MADYQNTSWCPVSSNLFVEIDQKDDKKGVGEVNRGRFLCMYKKHT